MLLYFLYNMTRRGAARLARQAHNLEVVGSNPTAATRKPPTIKAFLGRVRGGSFLLFKREFGQSQYKDLTYQYLQRMLNEAPKLLKPYATIVVTPMNVRSPEEIAWLSRSPVHTVNHN